MPIQLYHITNSSTCCTMGEYRNSFFIDDSKYSGEHTPVHLAIKAVYKFTLFCDDVVYEKLHSHNHDLTGI